MNRAGGSRRACVAGDFEQCLHVVFERPRPCLFRGSELMCQPTVVEDLLDVCGRCRTWPGSYELWRAPPLPPGWDEDLSDGTVPDGDYEDSSSEESPCSSVLSTVFSLSDECSTGDTDSCSDYEEEDGDGWKGGDDAGEGEYSLTRRDTCLLPG
ncbi:hypothetical protein GGTG_04986 [Gaeumannomyces tritici R3-111a-1]|uniref:Uncharacterized protein n=1 Tax=Gaeumannomyces tritici (strain R3-111a-1) TaxID=644352 RepID=J3NUN0_GAET3|nr:hypothetical protein GGTG_04986 [Gaeumannomyces tritici R3-111a-1]EJT79904.1 hypothetical protein GGTG_04986 [Gaeumannomyces tritici R3-111a-1]